MEQDEQVAILERYIDALSQAGDGEKAVAPVEKLLKLVPQDLETTRKVAHVLFDHAATKARS